MIRGLGKNRYIQSHPLRDAFSTKNKSITKWKTAWLLLPLKSPKFPKFPKFTQEKEHNAIENFEFLNFANKNLFLLISIYWIKKIENSINLSLSKFSIFRYKKEFSCQQIFLMRILGRLGRFGVLYGDMVDTVFSRIIIKKNNFWPIFFLKKFIFDQNFQLILTKFLRLNPKLGNY